MGDPERAALAKPEGSIDARLLFPRLPGETRDQLLRELAGRIAAAGRVRDAAELSRRLLDRERLGCTGLGAGIALPHCKLPGIDEVITAVATSAQPVEFAAADGKPVDLVVAVVSPADAAAAHLHALARISRVLRMPGVAARLRAATSEAEMETALREAEAALPPHP